MTNKQIASWNMVSIAVFILALLSGGDSQEGITMMLYFASVIGIYTFMIWGWVRLFKSDK